MRASRHAVAHGEFHEVDEVVDLELLHYVRPVGLDGLDAYRELLCYGAVAEAVRDEAEYLLLLPAQHLEPVELVPSLPQYRVWLRVKGAFENTVPLDYYRVGLEYGEQLFRAYTLDVVLDHHRDRLFEADFIQPGFHREPLGIREEVKRVTVERHQYAHRIFPFSGYPVEPLVYERDYVVRPPGLLRAAADQELFERPTYCAPVMRDPVPFEPL